MRLAATPRELQVASETVSGELYSLVRLYEEVYGQSTITVKWANSWSVSCYPYGEPQSEMKIVAVGTALDEAMILLSGQIKNRIRRTK
jgi:hypothetical protein